MSTPIEIDVHGVHQLRQNGEEFLLIDCREPFEYETASIDGAQLIPMGELASRVEELEPYRDQRIVIHCHHGGRSLQVASALRNAGFGHAQSMAGGIEAWSLEIDQAVPRY
jgi:rhodanese-related sulfurtransferase